ncbi:MAG: zinc ribbon domain-containing protein [Acidobacteriia bacterium]|nr:zinc ribbon domain-containing protein [Terriglobia bacterium]
MSDYQRPLLNEKMRLIRFRMRKENLRFADEIRLIPRTLVWVVAGLFVIAQAVGQILNRLEEGFGQPDLTQVQSNWALAGVITAAAIPMACIIFLIGYISQDARRRGMNAVLWTLLVIMLLPGWLFIGFVIYFLVREPLPYHCTQCGVLVSARFNYCPGCKYNLRPTCQQCQREVGEVDHYCPHCGSEVTPQPQRQAQA